MTAHRQFATLHDVVPPRSRLRQGFFGRLFPELPAWDPQGSTPSDEKLDRLIDSIVKKMIDPGEAVKDSIIPAGYTFFGQFIDHDITFDPTSSLVRQNDPDMLHNFRTPRLDLDSVYLDGPKASPHLYENPNTGKFGKFLIGKGENPNEPDLPRNEAGTALIGDPRNDENVLVSQLQLAFLKFHNRILDEITGSDPAKDKQETFDQARRITTWTYQYVVWNDFLKRILQNEVWSSVLIKPPKRPGVKRWTLGNQFYKPWNTAYMPVEFSVAAYRFGHSLVRNGYLLNATLNKTLEGQELEIFSTNGLQGGQKLRPNHTLQWDWFLEFPTSRGGFPQRARQIDTLLSQSLSEIPPSKKPLAKLNLIRGFRMGLPSGPDVARYFGLEPIASPKSDALWVYILQEAENAGGDQLGTVGSTIVGEVFAGLLYEDNNSFINIHPTWTPSKEPLLKEKGRIIKAWELRDIIHFAGMPESAEKITELIGGA